MAERVNVTKTFRVTTPAGEPFFTATFEYHSMPYAAFVELEKREIETLQDMTEYSQKR